MASFMILTGEWTIFSQNKIFNVTKRLQRIERNVFTNYRLYLNFTDHYLAMIWRAIRPNIANIVPALLNDVDYT